ncbi:MAG: PEP-CTERM sorting domain-containing protein [Akkermansiaceae bacterium]|jgi:hypothetical protein
MKPVCTFLLLVSSHTTPLSGAVMFQIYERTRHPLEPSLPVVIDFNGDGINDLTLMGVQDRGGIYLAVSLADTTDVVIQETTGTRFDGFRLEKGFAVDDLVNRPLYSFGTGQNQYQIADLNDFANEGSGSFFETSGYLGVRFQGEEGTHYGYVHLNGERVRNFNVISYAYESEPNTPILTGAIPEPSTTFALFLSSLMLWRRRP